MALVAPKGSYNGKIFWKQAGLRTGATMASEGAWKRAHSKIAPGMKIVAVIASISSLVFPTLYISGVDEQGIELGFYIFLAIEGVSMVFLAFLGNAEAKQEQTST